jgi:hypothetical protein
MDSVTIGYRKHNSISRSDHHIVNPQKLDFLVAGVWDSETCRAVILVGNDKYLFSILPSRTCVPCSSGMLHDVSGHHIFPSLKLKIVQNFLTVGLPFNTASHPMIWKNFIVQFFYFLVQSFVI